jgi:Fe-Mn family superoxide dismutase
MSLVASNCELFASRREWMMLRRIALTNSGAVASATAVTAPMAQQRCIGVHLPKSEIIVDKFDINREMNEFRARTGRVPDHKMENYRALYWRLDEVARRTERYIQNQGFFHLPILEFPVYKGCPPLMSAQQLRLHYGRHHRLYIDKLNTLLVGSKYENMHLDDIIRRSAPDNDNSAAIFNNAAQHYNHCFFWKSIAPWGVNCPPDFRAGIEEQYGSWEAFLEAFETKAMGHFGSGWIWLVYDGVAKKFDILALANAGTPITMNFKVPLLVLDAWEHAWYADYENDKAKYVKAFLKVADYHWAERHWKKATSQAYNEMKWQ